MTKPHDPLYEPELDGQDGELDGGPGERVAKALARAGVASRREVERLIEAGRVAINGKVLTTPAVKVQAGDFLTVDGQLVAEREPTRMFRYHKPTGLMTTHNDPKGRPTVFQSLPKELPRLISIGRLDLNSEGLLLLTNDGEVSRALETPSNAWVRRYRARAFGDTTQAKLDTLKDGITVEGVKYGAIEAKIDKAHDKAGGGKNIWITVSLSEGKNREVRRVLEALGLKVNRLIRLSYGPFALGALEAGQIEEIGPRVIRELMEGIVSPENMPTGDRPKFGGIANAVKAPGTAGGGDLQRRGVPRADRDIIKPDTPEKSEKPVYKAGWAKPKKKVSPHAPAKGASKGIAQPKAKRAPKSMETKFIDDRKPVARGKPPARPAEGAARRVSEKPGKAAPRPGPKGPAPRGNAPRGGPKR
ncbi:MULTISPECIES: pseudouridine synthase [unclassified Caulobacter]|uniref:pseudouridine synthase n=1 Tax=unclassified Caulobacter TaxID=2648921 RepID=UPI000700BE8F|nr:MULTISPECIES: pseudouridine synthase [unclassified Caulobacter]KQV55094.1 RNA-binding protein [Caulobacter sp. Root342]KQV63719.1 RNA-binding protein [Caulobacter sp. Root343]